MKTAPTKKAAKRGRPPKAKPETLDSPVESQDNTTYEGDYLVRDIDGLTNMVLKSDSEETCKTSM